MTKKQAGIICTLLALIVCTALLAARLNNGGLNDPTDLSTVITNDNGEDQQALSTQDFFYNSKSEREQNDASTIQNLKAIAADKNTSDDQKKEANKQIQKITLKQDKEKTIELNIKNKGYEDAICQISDNQDKASLIVKANELSEKDGAILQEIVETSANIKEVTIEFKK